MRTFNVNSRVDPKILNLVVSLEKDLNAAINEALNLWLKQRVTVCPITNQFCKFIDGSCNDCTLTKE
jgi:hypothetical protein